MVVDRAHGQSRAALPATQINTVQVFYDCVLTMACPPNLVADSSGEPVEVYEPTRNVLLKCGIHLEHADQRLGDVIEYEMMYVNRFHCMGKTGGCRMKTPWKCVQIPRARDHQNSHGGEAPVGILATWVKSLLEFSLRDRPK